jgi:rhodanese-related sulfurtransferase
MKIPRAIAIFEMEKILKYAHSTIVDIREKEEFALHNLGGINVPSHTLNDSLDAISSYQHLVVLCSNGLRSSIMARVIQKKLPQHTIYFVAEGIE